MSLGKLDGSFPKGALVTIDVTLSVDSHRIVLRDVPLVVTGRAPLSGTRVKLTFGMVREIVLALGGGKPGDKPRTISLSKTSTVLAHLRRQADPRQDPQPATSPPAATEPEPATAS